jgi:hypothetical protein
MRHGILTAAFLLTSAGFASADYVIIVANVGQKELQATTPAPMPGMPGMRGQPGMPPGAPAGMYGGQQRQGQQGMMGQQGMRGMPQAPGMPGGQPQPGMMGMRGGSMMGMPGSTMQGNVSTADEVPDYVIAVIEVKPHTKNLVTFLETNPLLPAPVDLPGRLGKSCQLVRFPSFGELFVITEDKKPIKTVSESFKAKLDNVTKNNPSTADVIDLAHWTLQHGLVDKIPIVMAELIKMDKKHPAAVAYQKVQADLDRKSPHDPSAASWLRQLLPSNYKVTDTPHYLIVHNAASDTAAEVKSHGEHLENAFRGYYYWFALKEIALTVPQRHQIAMLTNTDRDFEQLRAILNSSPEVVDGFFARRETLPVMYSQRRDDPYKALSIFWDSWKAKDFNRAELLNGKKGNGSGVPLAARGNLQITAEAQMLALMLKALEQEAELATVSHEASRQLLFSSGLLPRNVAVPEWILFGMGSFFETPLESPWPTIGAPSPYYLPRWRELKALSSSKGGLEKSRLATLRKVVTDAYFRTLPTDSKADQTVHQAYDTALRKARTVTWSLTYFLAQQKLDGLRRYFTELSKLPRDVELDDTILLNSFARAFGCVDGNSKVDDAKLKKLADEWYGYYSSVYFESETHMKSIRETIVKKRQEAVEKAKKQEEQNNAQQGPGMYGPGMNRGGMGPMGPGGAGNMNRGGMGPMGPGGMNRGGPAPPAPPGPPQGGGNRPPGR